MPVPPFAIRMLMLTNGVSVLMGASAPIHRLAPSCHEARSTRSR